VARLKNEIPAQVNRAASLELRMKHISRFKKEKTLSPAMANFLWKVLGFYLLLMGVALMLTAALR